MNFMTIQFEVEIGKQINKAIIFEIEIDIVFITTDIIEIKIEVLRMCFRTLKLKLINLNLSLESLLRETTATTITITTTTDIIFMQWSSSRLIIDRLYACCYLKSPFGWLKSSKSIKVASMRTKYRKLSHNNLYTVYNIFKMN